MRAESGHGWELRLGDCTDEEHGLTSLESIDHLISDPPYSRELYKRHRTNSGNIGGIMSNGKVVTRGQGKCPQSALDLADEKIGAIDDTMSAVADALESRLKRWCIVFHDDESWPDWVREMQARNLRRIRTGVWLKPDPTPQITGDRPAQDVEWWTAFHQQGRCWWNGRGNAASIVHQVAKGKNRPKHPSPKPLAVMEHFIRLFTVEDELVCDPFAGSGTTGVACIRHGRRFIGWERDEAFFETAVNRLRTTRRQFYLFDAQEQKMKQESML